MNGLVRVFKPVGPTSTDMVRVAKRVFGTRAVGHLGTLDPAASGLLLLGVGEGAKVAQYLDLDRKAYEFDIVFGRQTNTDDDEGEVIETSDKVATQTDVAIALSSWVGEKQQVPPQFSAIKIDGVRSYKRARKGELIDLPPRSVRFDRIELLSYDSKIARVSVECGSGTYMRSLARDIGAATGALGHARNIFRTGIGVFELEGAKGPDDMTTDDLIPLEEMVLPLPRVDLDQGDVPKFRQGQFLPVVGFEEQDLGVAVFGPAGLVGMGRIEFRERWILRPKRVFTHAD